VVLDQVVALGMVAIGAAALGVDERMRHGVGGHMGHVAHGEGQELLCPFLHLVGRVALALSHQLAGLGAHQVGLLDEALAQRRGLAVVAHVAPQEELLTEPLLHAGVLKAEDVLEGQQFFLGDELQRHFEFVHYYAELAQNPAGEVVGQVRDVGDQRTDRGVPAVEEVLPDLLQLDQ
jgi:hypothetical protein